MNIARRGYSICKGYKLVIFLKNLKTRLGGQIKGSYFNTVVAVLTMEDSNAIPTLFNSFTNSYLS